MLGFTGSLQSAAKSPAHRFGFSIDVEVVLSSRLQCFIKNASDWRLGFARGRSPVAMFRYL